MTKGVHRNKSLTQNTKFILFILSFGLNIPHEILKLKGNWFCHILRRNCILQQVIEGKIKGGI